MLSVATRASKLKSDGELAILDRDQLLAPKAVELRRDQGQAWFTTLGERHKVLAATVHAHGSSTFTR
jgi:hypothetical protein